LRWLCWLASEQAALPNWNANKPSELPGTTILYRFSLSRLGTLSPPPAQAGSLANAEAYVPLIFFVLSLTALWFYVQRGTRLAGASLIIVLLLDLAAFGHFFYWRTLDPHIVDRLADSEQFDCPRAASPERLRPDAAV
jgi:hypothetical protein